MTMKPRMKLTAFSKQCQKFDMNFASLDKTKPFAMTISRGQVTDPDNDLLLLKILSAKVLHIKL